MLRFFSSLLDVRHGPPRRGAGLRLALGAQCPSGTPAEVAELSRVYASLVKRCLGKVQVPEALTDV